MKQINHVILKSVINFSYLFTIKDLFFSKITRLRHLPYSINTTRIPIWFSLKFSSGRPPLGF